YVTRHWTQEHNVTTTKHDGKWIRIKFVESVLEVAQVSVSVLWLRRLTHVSQWFTRYQKSLIVFWASR
ncbi:TPA: hypothetical protein N0F65_005398, partial [Lagenidium giganteum]